MATRGPAANGRGPAANGHGAKRPTSLENAKRLRGLVGKVSSEEFRWQESHYDQDSRQGRELLFLIANHEWVRATSEIVDVSRSDAVDTSIKIDIDLDQITHEAFRKRKGRFWLPITVLPPESLAEQPASPPPGKESPGQESPGQQVPGQYPMELDPFATVTDAAGNLLPMLPIADVRHQMAAAMAEIIVNMAVARWAGSDQDRPTATRDQRLMLSAAIYRWLRREPDLTGTGGEPQVAGETDYEAEQRKTTVVTVTAEPEERGSASRIGKARAKLLQLLDAYIWLLANPAHKKPRKVVGDEDSASSPQFAPELTRRAVKVLSALTESMVVVVPIERDLAPTVLTVRVPTRSLLYQETTLRKPWTWILRPLGHLEIDVLLPTADADRQVQIHLPDGMAVEGADPADGQDAVLPRMDIEVRRPQPLKDLTMLLRQILDERQAQWPPALRQSLADLARSKAQGVQETLQNYELSRAQERSRDTPGDRASGVGQAVLAELGHQLERVATAEYRVLAGLREAFERDTRFLFRRTIADRPSPRTAVARADMIEDPSQRAIPKTAKVHVFIKLTDLEYFSIARFSGGMSLLLMAIVLAFLLASRLSSANTVFSPEVLAIVLTLFSAIQAGQMERPDRSTLRGLLAAAGNWIITMSLLPAVVLAVALAFPWGGWIRVYIATACVVWQVLFLVFMRLGPLTPGKSSPAVHRRNFTTMSPDYRHFEALRSDYWRATTADSLLIGRMAYAYGVWQKGESPSPQLKPLLNWHNRSGAPHEAANVVALLRAGTLDQSATFVVFRREPIGNWAANAKVTPVDLDPDRLAPLESITSTVDIFVGVRRDELLTVAIHPAVRVLQAAAHRLLVLEAQLPVPTPVGGYGPRHWARIRVALRDNEDIRRLAPFLDTLYQRVVRGPGQPDFVLAVQTIPASTPRVIAAGPAASPRFSPVKTRQALASQLDVAHGPAVQGERGGARTWRVLTMCTDARSNVESDIMQALASARPQLELSGLEYALLHGTAVVVMLGHEPRGSARRNADLETELRREPALAKLRVLVDESLSRNELGDEVDYPLLRVHFRWQDRPGAVLNVLNALSRTLHAEPPHIQPADWSISYARTQIAAGRSALARLTVRLHVPPGELSSWTPATFEEIERKVRTLAAIEATSARYSGEGQEAPEDPVISVNLIETPAEE